MLKERMTIYDIFRDKCFLTRRKNLLFIKKRDTHMVSFYYTNCLVKKLVNIRVKRGIRSVFFTKSSRIFNVVFCFIAIGCYFDTY